MTTYTAEETAANRAQWVVALRSGEFAQGKEELRTTDGEFCCLGVACELAAREGIAKWGGYLAGYDGNTQELPDTVAAWLGIAAGVGELKERIMLQQYGFSVGSLAELNDDGNYTFNQIADLIEADNVRPWTR